MEVVSSRALWPIGLARTEWPAQACCSPADLSSQRARLGQFGKPISRSAWALASVWQSATRPRFQRCSPGSTAIAGWRAALTIIGLGVAGFGFVASNWIRRPPWLPRASASQRSYGFLRKLAGEPSFRRLYVAGFLSSLVLLIPIVHMIPHAVRAGVAARDAAWLISILGLGSLAGRLILGHAADRLGR